MPRHGGAILYILIVELCKASQRAMAHTKILVGLHSNPNQEGGHTKGWRILELSHNLFFRKIIEHIAHWRLQSREYKFQVPPSQLAYMHGYFSKTALHVWYTDRKGSCTGEILLWVFSWNVTHYKICRAPGEEGIGTHLTGGTTDLRKGQRVTAKIGMITKTI